jgi:hypothetical protein
MRAFHFVALSFLILIIILLLIRALEEDEIKMRARFGGGPKK